MTRLTRAMTAVFTTALILLLCFTESVLEMQHGIFLCCFFPLLHYCGRPTRSAVITGSTP